MLTLLILAASGSAGRSQDELLDTPALLSADQVDYDQERGVVTATGSVEIVQDERILRADKITFDLATRVVTATGNIALLDPSGDVVFAEHVELGEELKEGFIRDIRVLLADRSRLAAASGRRSDGNLTRFRRGIFSPCELCREDPTRAPLWQIKAVEIEHDQEKQVIRYRDAWMEFYGVPVVYTPYFEHPDPTVERTSGFLAPTFGGSDALGTTVQLPYYWTFGPDQDLTFAPIITTEQGVVATGEYRHLFPKGRLDLRASATRADRIDSNGALEKDRFRGHLDLSGRLDIDDTWRAGADVDRTTDDTYLRLYNFSNNGTLTSRAYVEGLRGRNHASVQGLIYQGLRATDRDDELPIVAPLLDVNYLSDPGWRGSRASLDVNLMALTRLEGRDSRRLSLTGGWEWPFMGPIGDQYRVIARVQSDGYWTDGVDPNSNEANPPVADDSDLTGRVFPQLALQWRYPLVRHGSRFDQLIEPVAQVIAAPNGSNPGEIPNEDSLDFEFDDTNLFSLNRFTGLDRVSSGSRFDYGVRWNLYGKEHGIASAFVGQSYRLRDDSTYDLGSGLEDNFSDIVGRVSLAPRSDVNLSYRFRLDKDDLEARRNEIDLRIGPPALNLDVSYIFVDSFTAGGEFDDREELKLSANSRLSENWYLTASTRRDLAEDRTLDARVGIAYEDECFRIELAGERNFFSDREIEAEDSIFLRLSFKHLGGFSSGRWEQ